MSSASSDHQRQGVASAAASDSTEATSVTGVQRTLFVDLDGTLVATDLLWEQTAKALLRNPLHIVSFVSSLVRGRAAFKDCVARRSRLDVGNLPYREEVLRIVQQKKAAGYEIVLATASPLRWANAVADHVGLFDAVLATEGDHNVKGTAKLQAIQRHCQGREFEYLGDAWCDMPIWRRAKAAYLVTPPPRLLREARRDCGEVHVVGKGTPPWSAVHRALRPHQWVKNLLLFVPLILAHQLTQIDKLLANVLAFVSFCAAASAVYVLNDLVDLEADRAHPVKCKRPLASGTLPIAWAAVIVTCLVACSLATSVVALPAGFTLTLLAYALLTSAYSFALKHLSMVDVIVLASLYTLRILAGGAAVAVPVSEWLLAMSIFFFTSLAFAKRHAELARIQTQTGEGTAKCRDYRVSDLGIIESMGPASGFLAVLVFALYINSENFRTLYHNEWALWLLCPVLLFWVGRLWLLASRRELPEDPVAFATRDPVSWAVALLAGLLVVLAAG